MWNLPIGIVTAWLLLGSAQAAADEFFSVRIEPLLRRRCYECHSHEGKIKGGLVLDSRSGWERGGDSGPAIVPGKPSASLLLQAVSHAQKDLRMPPQEMLPAAEIALLTEWITRGAPDPRVAPPASPAALSLRTDEAWEAEFQKRLNWWSLKPMRELEPPAGNDVEPVDRFIRAKLDAAGLSPAAPADDLTLRRRLAFVLTGLPPVLFESDEPIEAYVDRLLQSPHFGERFARHWMDVVRYTDTYGYEWDNPAKGSHEYRDYLIRAFNDDLGFDQLLREQLAGDLLAPRVHPVTGTNESLIAPMFYHLGEHRHGSSLMFNGIHQDMVNNKIDAFSKAFLGTTVACARCHDHKLEAISQHDYYALAAVFTTPRWTSRVADAPGKNDAAIASLKDLRGQIRDELAALWSRVSLPDWREWAEKNRASLEKAALPGISYPVGKLLGGTDFNALAAEWRQAREEARQANAAFTPLADTSLPAGWVTEGDGMRHGFVEDGTPLVALEGDAVVAQLLPRGWHTRALSSKLPGALRMPPQLQVPGRSVSLKLAGGEFGGHLVVDDHAFQNETIALYTNAEPEWKTFADAGLKNGAQQVTIEFTTSSLNPNFPPRTGLAKGLPPADFGYDKRSWISITGIVSHDAAGLPRDELDAFRALYAESPAGAWDQVAAWMKGAVERWCARKLEPGDRAIVNWLLAQKILPNQAQPGSKLASLVAEYRRIEGGIAFPRAVNSMDERETAQAKYPLNVRGNVDAPGDLIEAGFLSMFGRPELTGRLEIANSLLEPGHPLTARVYVNRVWHWIFGTGLVATPDDFGRLGDPPSHPELLDWLAREFIREGWSTKKLIRRLVLSQTFRQSGQVAAAAHERDPGNRLLHHYPTRRLEAEAIRDTLLAVAGRLDPTLYGRPVLPFRPAEDDKKRLFSGPLDGGGRRSIYLQMSIMDPPKILTAFNLPDLKLPTGRRDVTNVPAQALVMLNNPLVESMAEQWAAGIVRDLPPDPNTRLTAMFRTAYGRPPSAAELARWNQAVRDFAEPNAWVEVAHALFNTKEFIYYR